MKLAQILEGLTPAQPQSPEEEDPGELAQRLSGPDGQAQHQVRKQLEQQQQVKAAKSAKPVPQVKRSLQQLQNVPWDPRNSKFKQLAGQILAQPPA